MTLQALGSGTLFQLLLGVGAAVTLMYLLRLRRRQVEVPFSLLWTQLVTERDSRSLLHRFKRFLSWLLAMSFVSLLLLAAADPRPDAEQANARSLLILVDASASMQAREGETTRIALAKRAAADVLKTLRPQDSAMLVKVTGNVEPLTPLSRDRRRLLATLEQLKPGHDAAALGPALELAAAAARQARDPHIVLITDGAGHQPNLPESLPPLSVIQVGEGSENVSIVAFNARRYRSNHREYEVFVRVRNDATQPAICQLRIYADGALSEVLPLEVPAQAEAQRIFNDLPITGSRLEARLEVTNGPSNLLAADDRAYALLPSRDPLRVTLVTPGNLFLEGALLLNENLALKVISPADYPPSGPAPQAWVFDRFAPPTPPQENALFLAPSPEHSPWPVLGHRAVGEALQIRRGHPLTAWISLADLNAGRAQWVRRQRNDTVLIRSDETPLVIARKGQKARWVLWTFDPLQSDLPLRTSFPMMLMHTFDWFVEADLQLNSSYPTGQAWRIPLDSQAATATLTEPDGTQRKIPIVSGFARVRGRQPGFHTLSSVDGETLTVAASLADPQESDLLPREEPFAGHSVPFEHDSAPTGRPPWFLLAALALLWLGLEWPSYHRRWTV